MKKLLRNKLAAPNREETPTLMQDLARYIEAHCEETFTLETLSAQAHLSPHHLQRRFKAEIGVSPKDYQRHCRVKKLKSGLHEPKSVTHAIYAAGFGSSSRVYERLDANLGMTPRQYQKRGQDLEISYASTDTPLGKIMLAATDRGLCHLQFGETKRALLEQLRREYPRAALEEMPADHRAQWNLWTRQLSEYLKGQSRRLDLPLDLRGTVFQLKVWKYLQSIPEGETRTYAEVAQGIGKPKAVRAVASACAKNAVAIVVPCHRVLRGDGNLAGYRWGLERKRRLLELERRPRPRLFGA